MKLIKNLNENKGATSLEFRKKAALEAFGETAYYESLIFNYFKDISKRRFKKNYFRFK